MIWDALLQFLLRLALGLSLGLLATSAKTVPAGFFRVQSWILLGFYTLAALFSAGGGRWQPWGLPATCVLAALLSYVGSVLWLYERTRAGRALLGLLAAVGGWAAWQATTTDANANAAGPIAASQSVAGLWAAADMLTASCLLGFTLTAMLLGHWYLTSPGMKLSPLQRLIQAMAGSVLLRAIVCGLGLLALGGLSDPPLGVTTMIGLRWLVGLLAVGLLAWMAWQTLKIPNTQSATGILYVAVIATFLGELAGQLAAAGQFQT